MGTDKELAIAILEQEFSDQTDLIRAFKNTKEWKFSSLGQNDRERTWTTLNKLTGSTELSTRIAVLWAQNGIFRVPPAIAERFGIIEADCDEEERQRLKSIACTKYGLKNSVRHSSSSGERLNVSPATHADEIEDIPATYPEGGKKSVTVNAYERNPEARKACLKKFGYKCQICDFDFEDYYGEIGREFIHVHHLVPVSAVGHEYHVKPEDDLLPVCANCHEMLHRKKPPIPPTELKNLIFG